MYYGRRKMPELLQEAATALLTVGLICEPRWLAAWVALYGHDTHTKKRMLADIEREALRGYVKGDLEQYVRTRMHALRPERQERYYIDLVTTVREQFRRRGYELPESLFTDFLAHCRKQFGSEGQFPMQHAIRTMKSLLSRFRNDPKRFWAIPEITHPFRNWMRKEKGVDVTHFHMARPAVTANKTQPSAARHHSAGEVQQAFQF